MAALWVDEGERKAFLKVGEKVGKRSGGGTNL